MDNRKIVLAITGGGSEAIGKLLRVGGASSFFLEGIVPYSKESLDSFLGFVPEKYTSPLTARQMAMKAFRRALELGTDPEKAIGYSCCATLVKSNGEREGRKHIAYICQQTVCSQLVTMYEFLEERVREEEESILSNIIVNDILDVDEENRLSDREKFLISLESAYDHHKVYDLIFGDESKRNYRLFDLDGNKFLGSNSIIFPGSFNYIHDGHAQIVKDAKRTFGKQVYLEISMTNVDKPPLDYIDVLNRTDEILKMGVRDKEFLDALAGVVFSNTPKFYDKIWQYPTSKFLVGADTYNRILDPVYGCREGDLADLMTATGSRLVVAERIGHTLKSPFYLARYTDHLPLTKVFDISSTQIKKEQENARNN